MFELDHIFFYNSIEIIIYLVLTGDMQIFSNRIMFCRYCDSWYSQKHYASLVKEMQRVTKEDMNQLSTRSLW